MNDQLGERLDLSPYNNFAAGMYQKEEHEFLTRTLWVTLQDSIWISLRGSLDIDLDSRVRRRRP